MAQAVTVYRWDDPGAPQMTDGLPSEVLDVFQKCLVEGYGAKSALGWTRPFHNDTSHISVYRNNTAAGGSGGCVRFNREGGNVPFGLMRITHAVDMTAISTYVKRGYTQAFNTMYGVSSGYGAVKWVLVGTGTAFYFFATQDNITTTQGQYQNQTGFFAGDFYSSLPNDAGRFITSTSSSTDMSAPSWIDTIQYTLSYSAHGSATSDCLKIYSADNHNSSTGYGYFTGFLTLQPGAASSESHLAGAPLSPQLFCPAFIGLTLQAPATTTATDRLGVSVVNSTVNPILRGILPGLFVSYFAGYRDSAWCSQVVIDGINYLVLPQVASGGSNVFLKVGEWNDPYN